MPKIDSYVSDERLLAVELDGFVKMRAQARLEEWSCRITEDWLMLARDVTVANEDTQRMPIFAGRAPAESKGPMQAGRHEPTSAVGPKASPRLKRNLLSTHQCLADASLMDDCSIHNDAPSAPKGNKRRLRIKLSTETDETS